MRSSDDDEDLRSLCWHGDFCGALTLVSEPGRDAGGVADSPVVEPGGEQGKWKKGWKKESNLPHYGWRTGQSSAFKAWDFQSDFLNYA